LLKPGIISLLLFVVFYGCNTDVKTKKPQVNISIATNNSTFSKPEFANTLEQTEDRFSQHERFAKYRNQLLLTVSLYDSLDLWESKSEIIDSPFEGEGGGWEYAVSDSLSYYCYAQFGCSGNFKEHYYTLHDTIVMHRSVTTDYNAPLGYDQEKAKLEGDSTQYGVDEVFEELSIFRNNKIIYQLSPDCGAPNSSEYVLSVEKDVLAALTEIQQKVTRLR
jgi:hypothetical protein